MEQIKLEPCPFCGGKPLYFDGGRYGNNITFTVVNVHCEECGAGMTPLILYEGLDDIDKFNAAAKRWNRRPLNVSRGNSELSPCPWCGGEVYFVSAAKAFRSNDRKGTVNEFWIECRKCGSTPFEWVTCIIGDIESENVAKESLKRKWNKRISIKEKTSNE